MSTYYTTITISGTTSSAPTVVTQNITSTDNVSVTINTPTTAFTDWAVDTYSGCTLSSFSGPRGTSLLITPASGATSYVVNVQTYRYNYTTGLLIYRYGQITGTISGGGADTTPDAFTFTDQTNVALSSTITSNTITVSGITAASAISITGGTYSINGGAYTSTSGTVTNGQTVSVQHTSSASYSTATNTTLTIGGVSDTFTSTTIASTPDTTPDAFTFTDQTSVALSSTITSNSITVSGINTATSISITGGTYSINGGAYTSTTGTVTNGQTVTVQHTSSASYSTATNTTLTIGGVSDTFTSTTLAFVSDTTPDAFTFTDQTNVALSSTITSNVITVSGINAAASISISGGTYSINGGAYTSTSGTVTNGQTVTVQHTSSSSYTTAVNTTLTIGGVSDIFTSTTLASPYDTVPDPFTFTDKSGVATNATFTDNVTVTGLQPNYPITVTATGGTVDATTALPFSGVYASSKTVNTASDGSLIVSAKVVSSSSAGTATGVTVTIGGVSDTFTVTTYAPGTQVNPFTFTDVTNATPGTVYTSNTITVSGLSAGLTATVQITAGGPTYSKNGGAYTNVNGSVVNGDTITVRVTSSPYYSTSTQGTLGIFAYDAVNIYGLVSDTFTVSTPAYTHFISPFFIKMEEGKTMPVTFTSALISSGTLYWTLDGANTSDFTAVSGSFTVTGGTGTFNISTVKDAVTESLETYTLSIRSGSTSGTVLTTGTVSVFDTPASTYGLQIFDENGNTVLDTSTYTVKDSKYTVDLTSATSISVPSITSSTVAQVTSLSGSDTENTIEKVEIDYINKLLIATGSSFLASISLLDYR